MFILKYMIPLVLLILSGCGPDAGYHPQYIISQEDPLQEEETR